MTNYQPRPGDKVLLTLRATADRMSDYVFCVADGSGVETWISPRHPGLVRVEPAPVELPTGFCARIAATVNGIRGVRLGLGDPGDSLPWRVHPGDRSRVDDDWISDDDLSDVVVLDLGEVAS